MHEGFDVPDPRKGHILVELKTANAVKLVHYCTSARVIAMPTAQLNARRSVGPSKKQHLPRACCKKQSQHDATSE